ncbi:MAG: hypothetical protein JO277_03600, partial [Candidatus Eremiobacteraeota bacterium]|nr:hypothetical protein [Candidatus Eremiobacteraeota bacterium]
LTLPTSPSVTLGGSFTGTCTGVTGVTSGSTITVTVPSGCSLANSATGSIAVPGITNPNTSPAFGQTLTGTNFKIQTSVDGNPGSPGNVIIQPASSVSNVTLTSTAVPVSAGGKDATWTVGFTTSAAGTGTTGALAGADTVTVTFPSGFTIPSTPTVALTSGFTSCTAAGSTTGQVVTITLSGASCSLPANTAAQLTIAGITNAAAGTYSTATVATSSDTSATTAPSFTLYGQATKLVFTTSPAGANGGSAFTTQPVVTVEDASGNVVTNDNSTQVTLVIGTNPASGTLSGCTTNPITVTNGVATFAGCKIDKAGTGYTLTTTNNHSLTNNASSSFNVNVGSPAQLVFTQQPSASATGGTNFAQQPVVAIEDAGGNVTSDTSQVTLAITGGTGSTGAVLSCTTNPLAGASGSASFAGCQIDRPGTGYTLTATDGGLTSAVSSSITINPAADGSGTATIAPTSVVASSTGQTETLTFTVPTGGISANGYITVAVPANWSAPSLTANANGYTQANINGGGYSTSNVSVNGQTITVTTPNALPGGATILVRYGDTTGGGSGASAPAYNQSGSVAWTVSEKGTSGGSPTAIASSPSVNVANAADGSGTLTVSPTQLSASSTGKTLTFTYTETVAGGMNAGAVAFQIPSGWTAPQTSTANGAGYVTVSGGGGSASRAVTGTGPWTITVSNVTLAQNGTLTVVYGDKSSSGSGVTVTS